MPPSAIRPALPGDVDAENVRAVSLYESAGFRRVGTTAFTIGSQRMDDVVMLLERRF